MTSQLFLAICKCRCKWYRFVMLLYLVELESSTTLCCKVYKRISVDLERELSRFLSENV